MSKKKVLKTTKTEKENIQKVSSVIKNAKADETLNISTTTDDANIFLNFSIQCKMKQALDFTKTIFREIGGTQNNFNVNISTQGKVKPPKSSDINRLNSKEYLKELFKNVEKEVVYFKFLHKAAYIKKGELNKQTFEDNAKKIRDTFRKSFSEYISAGVGMILPVYIKPQKIWMFEIHVLCIPHFDDDLEKYVKGRNAEKILSQKEQYTYESVFITKNALKDNLDIFVVFSEIPYRTFKKTIFESSIIDEDKYEDYKEVIEEYQSWVEEISKGDVKKSREENISRAVYFRINTNK